MYHGKNHQVQARRRASDSNVLAQHDFARIPSVSLPRSVFNRSCGLKTTFDSGLLIPIFLDEALPGDTFSMKMTSFARMATPLHPIMDNMTMDIFFFAVPLRIIWDNFQKFMGEQTDPGDSTDFLIPVVDTGIFVYNRLELADYMGLPVAETNVNTSAMWFRAYNLIWNEWFRDQNLQDSVVVPRDDGPDDQTDYVLLRRGKRHDYFTSCLPFPQKGPSVQLPLGTTAPVDLDIDILPITGVGGPPTFDVSGQTALTLGKDGSINEAIWSSASGSTDTTAVWNDPQLEGDLSGTTWTADLSAATAATINQLREAFQIQRLFEKDARGGTRYTEILRSHFGVDSPDARLQRPEYLGGGSTRIIVNPVPQTSQTASSPQGTLTAYVTASETYPTWIKSFTEHCVILGMVNIRADLNYQQNIPRMFNRSTRFDFYWPSLAHLGEQAVLSKEIFFDDTAGDEDVFGYQERFAEYRYKPSTLTGQMRSNHPTSLDTWHLAQDFGVTRPLLNAAFIEENPPIDRVIAVPSEPEFLFDAFFDYRCVRPMPTYSVPGLIDHF